MATESSRAQDGQTISLLPGDSEDRCRNCGSPMVSDQRYCLNCGERRGQSRYSLEGMAAQVAPPPPPAPPGRPIRSRIPSSVTLVTGVATLLLAMGVGVLIGHDSNSPAPTKASQTVVTVGGGGATTPTATTASTSKKALTPKAQLKAAGLKKTVVVKLNKKTVAAAVKARQQVFGQGSAKNLPPATIQVGQKCPPNDQKGCVNGRFVGNFFPGG